MKALTLEPARRAALRPWILILGTAPLGLLLMGLVGYQWQTQRRDFARLADQYVQRQNGVLAQDARRVASAVSQLLDQAARDVRLFSLLPSDHRLLERFLSAASTPSGAYPRYNRAAVLHGKTLHYWEAGKPFVSLALGQCAPAQLCDRASLAAGAFLPEGKVHLGKALRWYTPESADPALPDEGTLSMVWRVGATVYLLGIDFRSFQPIVRLPTFPYQERGDLLQDYEDGNYIYLLDKDADLLAHPRRWHILGIDRQSGMAVEPMRIDAEAGKKPLNFRAYRKGKLRPYFDRLLAHAFQGSEVDVFQAANLSGKVRVVSVAPVHLDSLVFDQKGPFGYVGVGCAVEHFQEPEERLVPYY